MKTADLFKKISGKLSIFILLSGLVVLIGWFLGIPALKSILPNLVTMKANVAICFILTGLSLWLACKERFADRLVRLLVYACALTVFLTGFLTFCEYLFSWNPGIDQLLFKEPATAVLTSSPGRMAFNTAINFTIIGFALLIIESRAVFFTYLAQLLIIFTGMLSLLSLLGYLYGASPLYIGLNFSTAMALHTSVLFIIVCISYVFIMPDKALMKNISSDEYGGYILRRVLPVVILTPLTFGFLKSLAEDISLFNNKLGIALVAISNLSVASLLVYFLSAHLNKIDAKSKKILEDLKRASDEWQGTFDSISDLVFIQDKDFIILKANQAFLDALKLRPEEVIGRKCYEVVHHLASPWPNCPFKKTRIDQKVHVEEVDDPGLGVTLLITTSPIFRDSGKFFGSVHIAKDISLIKKYQHELENKNKELQKLDRLKTDFVSIVSHELRTPLSITKEGISLVLDGITGSINPHQNKILATAMNNIDRLARIINSLLDISKIESGGVELEKKAVNLGVLIKNVAFSFEAKAREKGLEFKVSLPKGEGLNLYIDEDRIIQVFTNLINNAVKFTEKGAVSVSLVEKENEIECIISDTGIGIAAEDLPKVFNKFMQFGRTAGAGAKGTGLGLSIAKGLVELHGGEIRIESEFGRGTRVYFTLPKQDWEFLSKTKEG